MLVRVATRSCAVVGGGGRIGFGEGEGGRLGELERVRVIKVARRGVGDRDRSGIPPPGLVGDSGSSEVVERVRKPAGVGGVTIGKGWELGGGGVRATSAGVGGRGGACACSAAAAAAAAATVEAALKYKSDLTNPGMSSSSSNARTPC